MHLTPPAPKAAAKPRKPRKPARHSLREKLIRMITDGEIMPGEKLMQTHLAKRFGVSISVMREALLDVQAQGLVETHDNRGFFVRKLDVDALIDLFDLRAILEGLAARKACAHATPADIRDLRGIIDGMCEAQSRGADAERAELDRKFHDRINQISNSHSLLSLTRQCSLFGKVIYRDVTVELVRQRHEPLLEAIASNQPELAEQLARMHVEYGRRELEADARDGSQRAYWHWLGGSPVTESAFIPDR